LRPRRLGERQRSLGDAVGPLAEIFERHTGELSGEHVHHQRRGLTGLHAALPGLFAGLELAQRGGNRPRRELTELMAADASLILECRQPIHLRDVVRNIALAAELVLAGNFQHREPVDCRIILRRRRIVRRRHRRQVDVLAGLGFGLGRIDETITADPNLVLGLG
jgi:hypothetical protein